MRRAVVQTEPKNEQVYEYPHSRIFRGDLEPGSRLVVGRMGNGLAVIRKHNRESLRAYVTHLEKIGVGHA